MFNTRSYEPEIMDDFALDGAIMQKTVQEIDFINQWLGGNAVTVEGVGMFYKKVKPDPVTGFIVADLGCGSGKMLRLLAKQARKQEISVRFCGIDANNFIISTARLYTSQFPEITYENLNVFSEEFASQSYDIITATLFCHHFTDEELIRLLLQLKNQAKSGIVINDLHRHWFAYYSITWLTRLFSKSYLVKNDARLSVLRAFRRQELEHLLQKAGLTRYTLRWRWAFRWQLIIDTAPVIDPPAANF